MDTRLESVSLSALNKMVLFNASAADRTQLLGLLVQAFHSSRDDERHTALAALSIFNSKIYGADDTTYGITSLLVDELLDLLDTSPPLVQLFVLKTFEGFCDAPLDVHFKCFAYNVLGSLVDLANNSGSVVQEACALAVTKLLHDVDQMRKDDLLIKVTKERKKEEEEEDEEEDEEEEGVGGLGVGVGGAWLKLFCC